MDRSLGYTHHESDGRDTIPPGRAGLDDLDPASLMKPGNVCLCLSECRSDFKDQQSDLLPEQLTDVQVKPQLVQDVARILRSLMSSGLPSHEIVDISEEGLHEQMPERELWHGQARLTPLLLSSFLSDQGQEHVEHWLAHPDSFHLFTLDGDSATWKWRGESEDKLAAVDMENATSADIAAVEKFWSDDNRSQQTGITSAVPL
ncbi:uncharacterized protein Z519_11190 [Cladophialophora bantiana CBS 173.52]|uniref:Uncharacterized protein n=1 Tax=Cladophialophora bantiana (strain ATCC 10958 / CBS 173.52 / CDC B-1940 / NIH 8579) TaxID=1442370 RepID=A0A0D2HB12_CLAB1|nr:uncharacterized protein Z519_11190 [Cladophialophora bantiana CBS 173.52]KIW88080.1 hypothetical protein Z519_11190 [Cladophialophora bantiana CBS 173.52]